MRKPTNKRPKFSFDAYRILLIQDFIKGRTRILVEGSDDLIIFTDLIDEISQIKKDPRKFRSSFSIDIAENIIKLKKDESPSGGGSRRIVESVCEAIEKEKYSSQLIGFVDREFRGFDKETLADNICDHYIKNRIVWTRGHSIENYLFNWLIIRRFIKGSLPGNLSGGVIRIAQKNFQLAISHACSISLAVKELSTEIRVKSFTETVDGTIDFKILDITSSDELVIDYAYWQEELLKRKDIETKIAERLTDETQIWMEKLRETDFDTKRWLCRGHTGMKFILAFLKFCARKPNSNIQKTQNTYLNKISDTNFLHRSIEIWLREVMDNKCEHPLDALKKVGMEI